MGIFRKLFGGGGRREEPAAAGDDDADFDPEEMIEELKAEGPESRAGDVDINSSPKQVCRYVFARLMAGTPAAGLRTELVERGFSSKVADAYITLIQSTLFGGSGARR